MRSLKNLKHLVSGLVLGLVLTWSFVVFRNHRFGIETAQYTDNRVFMQERAKVLSDRDFFWRVLSFDRTREAGSLYLYRPGLGAMLATIDIFFRHNFFVSGMVSIVEHGVAAFCLFCLARLCVPCGWALGAAILFATHFSGSSIVIWRHVSPYIMGLILFASGVYRVVGTNDRMRFGTLGTIVLFFMASLFHESFAYALPVIGVCLLIGARYGQRENEARLVRPYQLVLACWIGPFLYFMLNALDLKLNGVAGVWSGPEFNELGHWAVCDLIFKNLYNSIIVLGSFISTFLIPQTNNIPWSLQVPIYFSFGAAGLFCLVYRIVQWYRRGFALGRREILGVFLVVFLFVLVGALTVGRITPIGYQYLAHCNYYRYFGNFVICVLLIFVLYQNRSLFVRPLFALPVACLVGNILYFGYVREQRLGQKTIARERAQAHAILDMANFLRESRFCYAGGGDARTDEVVPPIFLYRESCAVKKGIPIYGCDLVSSGRIRLAHF